MNIFSSTKNAELNAVYAAINRSQAIIEFSMDGTIISANENFLKVMGYRLEEIKGKHHSIFIDPAQRQSREYADFWSRLNKGEADAAQYKRIGKDGREVWIEASYNPICDASGKPYKVVKFAIDVTGQKAEYAELRGQVEAIGKSQAVIEFTLDGIITNANSNFLNSLGYSIEEIKGKHHSMFVDPAYRQSPEYAKFWESLRSGTYQRGQFKRLGKGGRIVWIEASYNPILDLNGKPYKVVKYATDITSQIEMLDNLKHLIDVNFAEIDGAIAQSSGKALTASSAAAETSSNVQMVASAAEELAASISEISGSMAQSRNAADVAFRQTENAGEATRRLATAASDMGGIVNLIQNIAGQINLLALNATIESARAGEAGRGFAVVANEVKNLANQAARATEQIAREIEGVQSVSEEVVAALHTIRRSIETVQEYVSTTASAVEEQSAVTQSMSSNMQGAASAVTTVSENIGEISAAVQQVNQAVGKTKEAARILAR